MSAPAKGALQTSSPPQLDLHWGERVGRYQVLAQLSVGGMAELFLGFTSGPGGFRKYVALKRILPEARGDDLNGRSLSVPIEAGKTARFKLALTDIPER